MPPMLPLSRSPAGENCSRLLFGSLSVIHRITGREETTERTAKDANLSSRMAAGESFLLYPRSNGVRMHVGERRSFLNAEVAVLFRVGGPSFCQNCASPLQHGCVKHRLQLLLGTDDARAHAATSGFACSAGCPRPRARSAARTTSLSRPATTAASASAACSIKVFWDGQRAFTSGKRCSSAAWTSALLASLLPAVSSFSVCAVSSMMGRPRSTAKASSSPRTRPRAETADGFTIIRPPLKWDGLGLHADSDQVRVL